MRAKLHARWAEDAHVRDVYCSYAPTDGYRWRNLELTLDDDFDVLVVFDHPRFREYDPARTVVFQSEPAPSRVSHRQYLEHPPEAFRVFYDVERHHSVNIWHVGRSDVEASPAKTRLFSAVVSATWSLPRHLQRTEFVSRHLPTLPGFDHFGRGEFSSPSYRGPTGSKSAALLPYRYTFNAENWCEPNYFTEKILDAVLCETLCFYDGCPNLELFLDPATFIRIDMSKPDEALAIVKDAIVRDEWSRRIDAIREQKRRLLDELHPLELVRKVVSGEPVTWRNDRGSVKSTDAAQIHRVAPQMMRAQRTMLERIAEGPDRLGIVIDSRAQLADETATVVDALVPVVRPGDLVVLGGVGMQLFRHVAARSLAGARELRHVVPTGQEKVVAYAATPAAARALLRSQDLRPDGVSLLAVWPPVAYVPGPFMRARDGVADAPLLVSPRRSRVHRVGGEVVSALPRGKRLGTVATEAASLAGASARRARLRGMPAWAFLSRGAPSGRSSSYPPAS